MRDRVRACFIFETTDRISIKIVRTTWTGAGIAQSVQ